MMSTVDSSISKWTIVSTVTEKCLAVIRDDNSGQCIRLEWSSIEPHWNYASFEDVEFCSADILGNCLVLCLTTAGGQGGVAAVWDLSSCSWLHLSSSPYIVACLPLLDLKLVLTLSFVDNVYSSIRRGYRLSIGPLDGSILSEKDKTIEIELVENASATKEYLMGLNQRFIIDPSMTAGALVGLFHDPKIQTIFVHDENSLKASAVLDDSLLSAVKPL